MIGFPDEIFLPDELRDRARFHAVLRALEEANAYLGQAESAARDIDQVLGQLLPHVANALQAEQAFVAQPQVAAPRTAGGGALAAQERSFQITVAHPSPDLAGESIPWSEWLDGLMTSGTPLERAPLDPTRAGLISELGPIRTISALVVRMEGLGDQRIVGLCGPSTPQDRVFLAEDLKAFKSIIDLLAVGWRVGEKRSRELESIRDSLAVVSAELNPDRVFALVVEQAVKLFDGAPVSLMLWDQRAPDTLKIAQAHGLSPRYQAQVAIPRRNVLKLRGPDGHYASRIIDLLSEPLALPELVREEGLRRALASPLQTSDGLIGVLNVYSKDPERGFSSSDQNLAQIFAHQVAIAIHNARLYQEREQQAMHWQALHRSGLTLAEGMTLNRQELLQRIARETVESLSAVNPPKAKLGVIRLLDRESKTLCFECVYPPERSAELIAKVGRCRSASPGNGPDERMGVGGRAMKLRAPQRVGDVRTDDDYIMFAPETLSELDVPLLIDGEPIGVLSVESDELNAFDQNDEAVLQGLAALVVVAYQNSERARDLELSTAVASMGAWGAEILHDAHDPLERLQQGIRLLASRDWPYALSEVIAGLGEDAEALASFDLRALSSGSAGQTCAVREMIRHEIELARAGNDGIEWDTPEPPDVPMQIEPHWGSRLLRHLLNNAIHHGLLTVPNPRISVAARVENGMVRVSVTNNGPRIPESEQNLLFRARLADEGGRRRGLLVVRFVAKRCGGDAEFRFSDERGTCFEFSIPLAREALRIAA